MSKFVSDEILEKCLDGFEFDSLARYMDRNSLTFPEFDEGIGAVEMYRYVRDILRFANENFGNPGKVRQEYKDLNVYEEDDGIFTIEIGAIWKAGKDENEFDNEENTLKIQFRSESKDNRWINIEFILFGQFPGYLN